jgi:hypothetical protein
VEYLLGSFATLVAVVVANRVLKGKLKKENKASIRYSQSHIYTLLSPVLDYVPMINSFKFKESQAYKYLESLYVKVMIVGNEAYWIKDNTLYTARLVEGEVDKDTTQKVDTMAMDKVQLEKTMFIVEKLREDQRNDSGSSGKPKL